MSRLPPRRSNSFAPTSHCILIALLALGSFLAGPLLASDPITVAALKRVEAKSQAVAARVMPATVGIINQSLATNSRLGEGSGVVVSEDGLIVTVGHVIAKPGNELTVIFPDGRRATAKALGVNFFRDAGLARLEPGKWPHVEMGHSDDIKPGAWCVALGHPGGIQQGRTPPVRLGRVLNFGKGAKFLVTDATVISGDSGGPLFDLDGRLIGVHSNIGIRVNQNQHVPIDAYREQWDALLKGEVFGTSGDLYAGNKPNPEKLKRFGDLLLERWLAGDPEARELMKNNHFNITPAEIDRLIAKWEKKSPPAGIAAPAPEGDLASKPLDFLKFQRLFQDRLLAGDPEVLKLIKNGTMMVTPVEMHRLMDQWEKKSLAAAAPRSKAGENPGTRQGEPPKAAPGRVAGDAKKDAEQLAKLRELLKDAEPMGNGRFRFRGTLENASDLQSLLGAIFGRGGALTGPDYGKSSPALLHDINPICAQAGRSTVVVLCDGRASALGTVVRKDGYIVTKASEIRGKPACKIGSRELPATVVKSNPGSDLALLKVDANDLVPITWAEGNPPPLGSWLITPAPEKDAVGLGVVSIPARPIPDAPKILLRNQAVVGVELDPNAKNARVHKVTPNLPAAKAGLKPGDVILSVGGEKTPTSTDVTRTLGKYKPGDKVALDISRGDKTMKLNAELVSSDQMALKIDGNQLTHLSAAGGTVSKRHNSFPIALTHDTVLQAAQCGGPVVDLDGRAIGLNIARADRTATYAIPARSARKMIADLLVGVK